MTPPALIGLYSSTMGSGKTAVSRVLHQRAYSPLSFAAPLKRMTSVFLVEWGVSPEDIPRMLYGDLKEQEIPGLGRTPRHLMQTLGTDWGRSLVHSSLWVELLKRQAKSYAQGGYRAVVDDVRFPNEAQAIKDLGGELWRVIRSGAQVTQGHVSEGQLDAWTFDRVIFNDGTLKALEEQVLGLITE